MFGFELKHYLTIPVPGFPLFPADFWTEITWGSISLHYDLVTSQKTLAAPLMRRPF